MLSLSLLFAIDFRFLGLRIENEVYLDQKSSLKGRYFPA